MCALGRTDPRGFVTNIELVGAAASDQRQSVASPTSDSVVRASAVTARAGDQVPWQTIASEANLNTAKSNLVQGEWLGWNIGPLNEDLWFVSTAREQGLMPGRGPSLLNKRWEWMNPVDVLLGAVMVPGDSAGRIFIIELATNDPNMRESAREQVVLAAVLPMLSQRVCKAFSAESEDRMAWLTPREEVVMWHLVSGLKVPQIAEILHRSIYTVHDHVKSLHRKLNANNRGQLVARALGHLGPIDLQQSVLGDEGEPKADSANNAPGAGGKSATRRTGRASAPATGAARRSGDR